MNIGNKVISNLSFQSIDLKAETINLAHFEDAEAKDLSRLTPTDQGRYHVFKFKHTHEGDYMESIGMSLPVFHSEK